MAERVQWDTHKSALHSGRAELTSNTLDASSGLSEPARLSNPNLTHSRQLPSEHVISASLLRHQNVQLVFAPQRHGSKHTRCISCLHICLVFVFECEVVHAWCACAVLKEV